MNSSAACVVACMCYRTNALLLFCCFQLCGLFWIDWFRHFSIDVVFCQCFCIYKMHRIALAPALRTPFCAHSNLVCCADCWFSTRCGKLPSICEYPAAIEIFAAGKQRDQYFVARCGLVCRSALALCRARHTPRRRLCARFQRQRNSSFQV